MTGQEFREKYSTSQDYRDLADKIADTITIRNYNDHGSEDVSRPTTKIERDIISKIAIGAMDTYGYTTNADAWSICNQAEFTLMQFLPEANTYDTIYTPLMKCFGVW